MTRISDHIPLFRRHAIGHRLMTWLTALVLCAQVLAGALLPVPAEAMTRAVGSIEICTAAGIMVMPLDAAADQDVPQATQARFCLFCLPLMQGAAAAPAPLAVLGPMLPAPLDAVQVPAEITVLAAPLRGAASPQAPPAL